MSDEAAGADPVSAEAVSPTSDLIIGEESSPETSEQMLSPVATKVFELLSPLVATAGVELIDVEWTGGTLRVVLDHPEGVTTETLTAVNRLISPLLDQHDPVPGRYTLEVSSPGVERPLRRLEHFRRAVGEDVVIKTVASVEPRRFRGALRSVGETEIVIDAMEIDGVEVSEPEPRTVAVADISTARTVFDWGPAPKVGPKQGQSKKSGPKSTKTHRKPEQQHSQRKAKRSAGNRGDRSGATGSAASTSGEEETAGQSESAQNRKEVGDE